MSIVQQDTQLDTKEKTSRYDGKREMTGRRGLHLGKSSTSPH